MPDLTLERALAAEVRGPIVGLDEVGRGPWAGPVVACAVSLANPDHETAGLPPDLFYALDDSKQLTARRREVLFASLSETLTFAVGIVSVAEIDQMNILQASLLAMRKAMAGLPVRPAGALVDGNRDPDLGIPSRLIVKGDSRSVVIAAASVLAKVTRDRMMGELAKSYPGYGWERNMGYGTAEHSVALKNHGVTEHHRKSFAPIHTLLSERTTS